MPKVKDSFEAVRKIGLALPGVEESTAHGSPALKLRGKLLACIVIHRSAEPNSLALRVSFEDRDALIAEQPDVYYVTEHYVDYPMVLARLSRANDGILRDLLAMSYKFVGAKVQAHKKRAPSPGSRRPK